MSKRVNVFDLKPGDMFRYPAGVQLDYLVLDFVVEKDGRRHPRIWWDNLDPLAEGTPCAEPCIWRGHGNGTNLVMPVPLTGPALARWVRWLKENEHAEL